MNRREMHAHLQAEHPVALATIAEFNKRFGATATRIETFTETEHERAAIYEYDAGMSRHAAEQRVIAERRQL